METTRLEMFFEDEFGEKNKLTVDNPRLDLIPSEIESAMNAIIASEIFVGKTGKYTTAVGAQVVTVNVNEIDF